MGAGVESSAATDIQYGTSITIEGDVTSGGTLRIDAGAAVRGYSEALSDARGLGVSSSASADVTVDGTVGVNIQNAHLKAPKVEILADTKGLDTYAHSDAKTAAAGVDILSTAYNDVSENAFITLDKGLITTHDLWVIADTLSDQSARAAHDYSYGDFSMGQVTYGSAAVVQRKTQIGAYTPVHHDVTADGELALAIDSSGDVVRDQGISWHVDSDSGAIVVDDFFYNGLQQASPQAHFFVLGPNDISNWISGNPVFTVPGVDRASIVNESANPLVIGYVGALAGEVSTWDIYVESPNDLLVPATDTWASYPNLLTVDSVGDVRLDGLIDMPHAAGLVEIGSDGSITGSGAIRAGQISLDAVGDIGTTDIPLLLKPGGLEWTAVAGGDLMINVQPTLASTTDSMKVGNLQTGGNMRVQVSPAVQDYLGATGPMPTEVHVFGPVAAGGNLALVILENELGGRVNLAGSVTAGGDIRVDSWVDMFVYGEVTGGVDGTVDLGSIGSIYLGPATRITAPGFASLSAGGSIYADPEALITAADLDLHADVSVGQVAAALTVNLTGPLSAVGFEGVYVRNQGGRLTVDRLFVNDGNASLTAVDTGGSDDLIVLPSGASMNVQGNLPFKGNLTLTAGDGILLAAGVVPHSDTSITLELDASEIDPDPGMGVDLTDFSATLFDAPVIRVRTGADDDSLRVADLAEEETVLDISTGAGNDRLRLGDTDHVLRWLNGTILFDGGTGSDTITVDNSRAGVDETGTLWLDTASTMAYRDALVTPLIRMTGMGDLWYLGVEEIDISLGLPGAGNIVDIDGTGDEVETVNILGTSGVEVFRVGQGMDRWLSGVHGLIHLNGGSAGEDSLRIIENNYLAGLSFSDDRLTENTFTGQGMDGGITWDNILTLSLSLLGNTDLTIAAAPEAETTVFIGNGTNEHTVRIGEGNFGDAAGQAAFPEGRSLNVSTTNSHYILEVDDHLNTEASGGLFNADGLSINNFWTLSTGFSTNRLLLGSGGGAVAVLGASEGLDLVTIVGGAGEDRIEVSALPAGAVLDILGGAGDDTLRLSGTDALEATVASVIFQGEEGEDTVWISALDAEDPIPALFLDQPETNPWPHMGSSLAAIRGLGMTNGIYYDAENIGITLTHQADTVYLKATTEGTESVTINGVEGNDAFYLGGADALTKVHGNVTLWGGSDTEDKMWVDNKLSTMDFDTGDGFDSVVGPGIFTGQGMEGTLTYTGFEDLGFYLGSGKDSIAIDFVSAGTTIQVNPGAGDDTLTLGYAEGVRGADLDRMAGLTLGLSGGEGNDALVLDDHQSTVSRNGVLIADFGVQNIGLNEATTNDFESLEVRLNDLGNEVTVWNMARPVTIESGSGDDTFTIHSMTAGPEWPLVIQAGSGNDRLNLGDSSPAHHAIAAPVFFYGDAGDDQVSVYDLDDGGRLEAWGEEGTDSFYMDNMGGGQTVLDGGDGADVLQLGWTAEFHSIAGDIRFYGQAGDDQAAVYQLGGDGALLFNAGDGDDDLLLGRTDGEAARLDHLQGPVVFEGGAGEDSFEIDGGSGGSSGGIATLTKAVPEGGSEAMAWASWAATAGGLFWAAEHGSLTLGGTSNSVHVQATAPECETLDITAYGDSEFSLEAQAATIPHTTLDDLHGNITLTDPESNDCLRIDNRASAGPLLALLTDSRFQILDASGAPQTTITYTGFDDMDVHLGDGSDRLTVGSLSAYAAPVVFSLGGGDDLLELGREGSLSRLAAIRSDITVFGDVGQDTVAFHDADNSNTRFVTFSGWTISGLLPVGLDVALANDLEQINACLGMGNDRLTVTAPGWDLRVDTGGGDDRITMNEEAPERRVELLGGSGNDVLHLGNGLADNKDGEVPTAPSGTVEFWGGAGNDTAYAYRSPSTALFNFYGEGDDDTLEAGIVQAPGTDPMKRLLGLLDGALCFYGADGYDTLMLHQTINGNVVARFDRSMTPNGDDMAHFGLEMNLGGPDTSHMGMDQGVWYDADFVSMNMGNTYTSTDTTDVYIDATAPGTQRLEVQREGGASKHFYVGMDPDLPLSAIHGQLSLAGGNSLIEISEAGIHDGGDALAVSWNPAVFSGAITSRWLDGIAYQGTGDIRITPTVEADTISIQSLQATSLKLELSDVQPTDLVVLGQSVGSTSPYYQVTVNGENPIYGMPTAAGGGSMTATEGDTLSVPVSILNAYTGHSLATLETDTGSLMNSSGAYTWQYQAGGSETIAFTATDNTGIRVQKLVDLVVQDTPPVANADAYSVREQKALLGNVLENDLHLDPQPTARLVTSSAHGAFMFQPDGSFSYAPVAGFTGDDTFTYQVNDGWTDSSVATVTIHVTANQAPVAQDDVILQKERFFLVRSEELLANDTDGDQDPLTILIVSQPNHGELIPNGDGSFHYVPAFFTEDSIDHFTYAVFDGLTNSAPALVTLEPLSNERPVANEDFIGTLTDTARFITSADLTGNDIDADGDPLQVVIKDQPEKGTLTPDGNGSWLYTPDAGFVGEDSFSYAATDGMKQSFP
ncbi:MAG: tandem-95 repeat protein, partial [Sedimentisphaerales bacterium]|nr:tandem-95 repeat protein [Sedimentisphaerales bacterium]